MAIIFCYNNIIIVLASREECELFAVGDKVVYPMHGAGIIEAIEEHEIFGEMQRYYVMTMPHGSMRVMIPLKNEKTIGLRGVITEKELPKITAVLRGKRSPAPANWNRRFNANLAKIKSGNIYEVAEVVRNLSLQDKVKKLSTGERRLLDSARQILLSELGLATNKEPALMEKWLNTVFTENTPGD